jgi:hypothetical protein
VAKVHNKADQVGEWGLHLGTLLTQCEDGEVLVERSPAATTATTVPTKLHGG